LAAYGTPKGGTVVGLRLGARRDALSRPSFILRYKDKGLAEGVVLDAAGLDAFLDSRAPAHLKEMLGAKAEGSETSYAQEMVRFLGAGKDRSILFSAAGEERVIFKLREADEDRVTIHVGNGGVRQYRHADPAR
jgi:hypothetical protein